MARIKIVDLPADVKISPEEMKKVFGGAPRTVTLLYPNPLDAISERGIIDPVDPRSIDIPPVTSDPSALRGINVPPASGVRSSAETWGGT